MYLKIQAESNANLCKYASGNTECVFLEAKQTEIWGWGIPLVLVCVIWGHLPSLWVLAVLICTVFLHRRMCSSLPWRHCLPFPPARNHISHSILHSSVSHYGGHKAVTVGKECHFRWPWFGDSTCIFIYLFTGRLLCDMTILDYSVFKLIKCLIKEWFFKRSKNILYISLPEILL